MIEAISATVGGNLAAFAAVLIAYIAGTFTPGKYAGERLQGFGRAVAAKLPYRPPPGQDESEAMQDATDE